MDLYNDYLFWTQTAEGDECAVAVKRARALAAGDSSAQTAYDHICAGERGSNCGSL